MSAPHIIKAALPSLRQKLLELVTKIISHSFWDTVWSH